MLKFFDRFNNNGEYRRLIEDTRGKNFTAAFGVQPTEKPFIAANFDNFVLYVCSDYVESQRILRTVNAVTDGSFVYVSAKDDVLLYKRSSSRSQVFNRNAALKSIADGSARGAVVCVEALLQPLPDKEGFLTDCLDVSVDNEYATNKLAKQLVAAGYRRVDGISAEGEFVLRGDVLYISMPFDKRYRVDFWGDEVESVHEVYSDMSTGASVNGFSVFPLYETSGIPSAKLDRLETLVRKSRVDANARARLSEIISDLQLGGGRADNSWLLPFVKRSTLADYLPQEAVVVWDEPKLISSRVAFLYNEHVQRVANLVKAGEILPAHESSLNDEGTLFSSYAPFRQLSVQVLPYVADFFQPQAIFNFKTGAAPNYSVSTEKLAEDIKNWLRSGYETVILAGGDGCDDVRNMLEKSGVYVVEDRLAPHAADGLVLPFAVEKGFVSHSNKLAVIGTRDLGRGMAVSTQQKNKKQAFLSVEKGDYVVHDFHGIGLCEGIEKITSPSGEVKDYIVVMYKNGDRLYVPVENSNALSRYSGGDNPTLSKIGGGDFAKVKEKVKKGIKEMSLNLLELYAAREKARGFAYNVDDFLVEEFDRFFPYTPTPDQLKCEAEINSDLSADKIMDRLLVGDVGFGKTEVAMRAAFTVFSNGYQVAVLAPTTILAEQHFKSFTERMSQFDVRIRCLNRFRTAEQQKEIIDELAEGKVDIIVGTHRLLSSDVRFARLGLLILDEEQRFGVEHKEKIKALKTNVDVITLSATPIPRTLHMALSGIRDISTITTPPVERMAVETFVSEDSDALIKDVIDRELSRGGQVFLVYNRVQSINRFAARVAELVPDARIVVAHGQMDETALEDAVYTFAQGETNVLICTTIIENGIDIPNANTLIVYDADLLGLSQLYQLRGRVGRGNRLAYAYFLYRKDKILNQVAYKRLSSITEYSELGSGFKIAMKDLEIRGAGNVLGREQHGHMVKVGYEMYARMLKETVDELRGEKPKVSANVDLQIDIEAYAPDTYIPTQAERMDFYQMLAGAETSEEVEKLHKQINDVYGTIPRETENLFALANLRVLAAKAGVGKISVKPGRGEITFRTKEDMMRKEVFEAMTLAGDRVSAMSTGYALAFSSRDYLQKGRLIAAITEFLTAIST